jgi:hypothetical protein
MDLSRTQRARLACSLAALLSFFLSIYLWFTGRREEGLFVGLWVPSILSSGTLLINSTRGARE